MRTRSTTRSTTASALLTCLSRVRHPKQDCHAKEYRKLLAQDAPVYQNGSHHRSHAEDEADVGDVGTQGVTKGQLGLAPRSREC